MKKTLLAALAVLAFSTGSAFAMSHPVTIADQGSFMAGGKTITAPGVYVDEEPLNFAGCA